MRGADLSFQDLLIRDVQGMQVKRSEDRYFEYLKIGLVAFMRSDGDLLDTAAVKKLRMSNT